MEETERGFFEYGTTMVDNLHFFPYRDMISISYREPDGYRRSYHHIYELQEVLRIADLPERVTSKEDVGRLQARKAALVACVRKIDESIATYIPRYRHVKKPERPRYRVKAVGVAINA